MHIVEPYNASRQPKLHFCQKAGKGSHVYVRAKPRPSCSAWAENTANAWLPYTNIWETSKGRNFNSMV